MAKVLTAAAVERLRPKEKRLEIADGGCAGLYLIVQPSGAKSWALRFRRQGGKTAKLTLGPVDLTNKEIDGEPVTGAPLSLAAARRLATELHHQRARGKDVVAAKRHERFERQARNERTFAAAVLDFVRQHAQRQLRRWQERARILGVKEAEHGGLELIPKGLADRWRDRLLAEIEGDDVHLVVDEARERGIPGLVRRADGVTESQALRVYAALSKFFSWAVERRRIRASPVAGVAKPYNPVARDRVLTDDEITKFWRAADAERVEFGALLKTLLLTGQRLSEVAQMRRSELSNDGAAWTIPGARTKNRREHRLSLPPLVHDLIASAPATSDIFIFSTDGRRPVSGWSKLKKRIDRRMDTAPWRLHDLRRTAATGMAELGIAPHIVEAVLNHVSGARAGVAGTYNRAAYASEKKMALERWAAHVEGLIEERPAKVVSLHYRAEA
jgi:integrase